MTLGPFVLSNITLTTFRGSLLSVAMAKSSAYVSSASPVLMASFITSLKVPSSTLRPTTVFLLSRDILLQPPRLTTMQDPPPTCFSVLKSPE